MNTAANKPLRADVAHDSARPAGLIPVRRPACLAWAVLAVGFGLCGILACSGSRSSRTVVAKDSHPSNSTHNGVSANHQVSPVSSVRPPEYRIGVLDQLEIRFTYHERFNETVTVRPDGRITLEGFGDIFVAGLTPLELDRVITEAYSKIVQTAEVTVFVRAFAGQAIYVLGQVGKPGAIDLKPNMTALQAVAAAGGAARGANLSSVMLLRRSETGELTAGRLDLSRPALKDAAAGDQYLSPQDVVYVPKTFITNVSEFMTQIYDIVLPPLDTYSRLLRYYEWY